MGHGPLVAPGDVLLNKYCVERVLGRGGMGIVVAVRHIDLDELFAIKLMLPSEMENAEAVERFLREARAAAKLKGEHVAKVQDVGRLPDGTPYMVLEHLTGSDLKQRIRKGGPIAVEDAVTYVLQACETLREAHGLGIIHRDIKPANIFLTKRPNGTPCVKVLDFGISKHTTGDVGLTSTGTVGGSPLYMSPEQMRSAKHVDVRTDIWSIGVVLYEMLIGAPPFHADTVTAVAVRVLQDEPVPPSQLRPEIPEGLDAVVLRCLAKRPDGRFPSMDELIAALRSAAQAPVLAPSVGEAVTMPLARGNLASIPDAMASAPALTSGPLPTSTTTAGFAQSSALQSPPAGMPAPRKINGVIAMVVALATLGLGLAVIALAWTHTGGNGAAEAPASSREATSNAAGPDPTNTTAIPGQAPPLLPITVEPSGSAPAATASAAADPREPSAPPPASAMPSSPIAMTSAAPGPGVAVKPAATAKTPSKPGSLPGPSAPVKKPRVLF
jgi:serine/threonine protein kinase